MAKKERQRRSARQARQRERVAAQEAAASSNEPKGSKKVAASEGKKPAASSARSGKEAPKKPKRKGRIRTYLGAVGSELRRVSWPSRSELTNYSVAVIVALIVVGAVVWLVDTGFLNLMFQFTKLRG